MKIVKLNRKYKAFRHGFTYALRYDTSHLENGFYVARKRLEDIYGDPGHDDRRARCHPYMTHWGRRDKNTRMYLKWIYLRNEADVTMLMLSGALDES